VADDTKKDDELENPNANPMAAFGPHLDDIAEALDILYIPKNPSGRLKFRDKWDFLADYIFDDELVDYDINGVKDHDRRKVLEDQANERRLKLKATLQEIVVKSVKSAQLQFDYVGQVIDEYGATLSEHLYAGDVVERVRPGLLKKEKDAVEEKAEQDSKHQKLSVDEAAILQNKEAPEQFDESDYNDVKPIVTDAPTTGKPGKMRDALDDMVDDFKSDSLKASTDGTSAEKVEENEDGFPEKAADDQVAKAPEDDLDDLEDVSTNQVDDGFDDLKSGDGALEDPKTELVDILDVVEKQDDLADVSDVENTLPDADDVLKEPDEVKPVLDNPAPVVDEKLDLPEPKPDVLDSAAHVESDSVDKVQELIAEKTETANEPSVAPETDSERTEDGAGKREEAVAEGNAIEDALDVGAKDEPDDRGVFVGRGSASEDAVDDDANDDFWTEPEQEQPSHPKVEESITPAPDEKPEAAVEVEPPKAEVPVPPPVADTVPPAQKSDLEADVKSASEPAATPEADVKVEDKPEVNEEDVKPDAVTEVAPKVEAPVSELAKVPDVKQDAKEPVAEEPKVAAPPATTAEDESGEAKPSVFGSPTLAGEKKQEPYSGMFNRLANETSEESLGVEILRSFDDFLFSFLFVNLTVCIAMSVADNRMTAPAWCSTARFSSTWLNNVAIPNANCPQTKSAKSAKMNSLRCFIRACAVSENTASTVNFASQRWMNCTPAWFSMKLSQMGS